MRLLTWRQTRPENPWNMKTGRTGVPCVISEFLWKKVPLFASYWASFKTTMFYFSRMLPSVKAFQDHQDMHRERDDDVIRTNQMILQRTLGDDDELQNHFADNVKSLQCPTCGKVLFDLLFIKKKYWVVNNVMGSIDLQVCTQQSALSNHMRMHEPKKFKCEICGRFFGLAVRLQVLTILYVLLIYATDVKTKSNAKTKFNAYRCTSRTSIILRRNCHQF